MDKNEYIIINRTAIQKRIEELGNKIDPNDKKSNPIWWQNTGQLIEKEINILKQILSESTPSMPHVEKTIENSKQETVEEAANKANGYNLYAKGTKGQAFNEGFTQGVNWQQEQDKNKYSEEEVKKIAWESRKFFHLHKDTPFSKLRGQLLNEWFSQFKKK